MRDSSGVVRDSVGADCSHENALIAGADTGVTQTLTTFHFDMSASCGCEQCRPEAPLPTYTEAYRHQTEVDYVAALPSREARQRYLHDLPRRAQIIEGLNEIHRRVVLWDEP